MPWPCCIRQIAGRGRPGAGLLHCTIGIAAMQHLRFRRRFNGVRSGREESAWDKKHEPPPDLSPVGALSRDRLGPLELLGSQPQRPRHRAAATSAPTHAPRPRPFTVYNEPSDRTTAPQTERHTRLAARGLSRPIGPALAGRSRSAVSDVATAVAAAVVALARSLALADERTHRRAGQTADDRAAHVTRNRSTDGSAAQATDRSTLFPSGCSQRWRPLRPGR